MSYGGSCLADPGGGHGQGKVATLDPSRRNPGDWDTRHRPPPPPGVRLRSAGMPRAQPDRSAPGGVGIPARRPTSSLTIFPLAAGRHRYSPRGAGVTPENFPWRGCAGDFHSPLRGLRSEAVLGRHLGLSRDRGWGWRTPFPPFPLTPLHTPRRSGRLALHSYFPSGLRWVGGFAWAEDFRFWGTPPF